MRRIVATELMDDPEVDARELAENFTDIEFANRFLGGIDPVARVVASRRPSSLLDVACGSGDVARALLRRARRTARPLAIVGLDRSETVLAIARERSRTESQLRFVCAEATLLPFADRSFDIAACNLALHHFDEVDAVRVLRELRRVSRATPLVCDLERSRAAYVGASLFARCIAKNRLTKHDGPLSVKRAYTKSELLAFAKAAGWRAPRARRSAFFRIVLDDRG